MSREQDKANMRAVHMDGLRESLAMREQAASSTQAISGQFPAPITNPEAWPERYADGFNDALRLVIDCGFASSTTPASGEPVIYQHRIKAMCGDRAGQWSLWGEVDREQYEYCMGREGHEVRALGVIGDAP